jgi:hypothetical protein
MLAINEDRMLADLRALAEFGKAGTGVNRPASATRTSKPAAG